MLFITGIIVARPIPIAPVETNIPPKVEFFDYLKTCLPTLARKNAFPNPKSIATTKAKNKDILPNNVKTIINVAIAVRSNKDKPKIFFCTL